MKAVIYARVSGNEQFTENQLPALEAFAAQRGFTVTERYIEKESAWKSGHQHELKRLLHDCRNGRRKFDAVLVWA